MNILGVEVLEGAYMISDEVVRHSQGEDPRATALGYLARDLAIRMLMEDRIMPGLPQAKVTSPTPPEKGGDPTDTIHRVDVRCETLPRTAPQEDLDAILAKDIEKRCKLFEGPGATYMNGCFWDDYFHERLIEALIKETKSQKTLKLAKAMLNE